MCICKCIYTHKPDDTPYTLIHMHARTNTHATHTRTYTNTKTRTNAHTGHIHVCHTPQTNITTNTNACIYHPPYIVLSISSSVYVPCHTHSLRRRSSRSGCWCLRELSSGAFHRFNFESTAVESPQQQIFFFTHPRLSECILKISVLLTNIFQIFCTV